MTRPLLWLASFPKSGSTWLRFLLHHLFHGPPTTSAMLDIRLPSLHGDKEAPSAVLDRGGVVLTPKAAEAHLERWPPGEGVVHLVRHPIDVVMSDTRFFVMTQLQGWLAQQGRADQPPRPDDIQALAQMFLTTVLQGRATPQRRELGVGTWDHHTRSWLAHTRENPRPGLVLRYEDLRRTPRVELRRLLDTLGLPIPDARIDAAVAACDVQAMRAMQEREIARRIPGRFYDPAHAAGYKAGLRFVGPAKMADLSLPSTVRATLATLYAEPMEALGYSLEDGAPPVGPMPEPLRAFRALPAGVGLQVAAPPRTA